MAWPLSRFQDFTDDTVPSIKAAFLHAVQDAQNAIFNGTQTLKALVIDRIGGVTVTPASPAIGSTVPGTAPVRGEYAYDAAPAAMGSINGGFIDNAGAGLSYGFGIHELHRNGSGDYYVIFTRAPSAADAKRCVVQVTSGVYVTAAKSLSGGRIKVDILLDGAVDLPFDVVAWIF